MATIKDQETFHANHAVVLYDGQRIARIQNLQANRDSAADFVREVGEFDPVEINHNAGSYRLTVGKLIFREGGPAAQFAKFNLGEMPPLKIEFQDRDRGTYFVAEGCEASGDSISVSVSQRVAENQQFLALRIRPKV